MTASVSAPGARPPELGADDALLAAAGSAARKGAAAAAKGVIDAIATTAGDELGRAITGTSKRKGTKSTASKKSGTAKTSAKSKGYSTKRKGEFAFLDDPRMSVEEKLFRFMQLMSKKSEDDLVKKMKEFQSEKKSSGKGASGGGGGLWTSLKSAVPGLATFESVIGDKTLQKLGQELGGPVLAAAVTAVGLPELAPVAMALGPELAKAGPKLLEALDAIPVGGSAPGSASSSSGSGLGATSDGKKTLSREEAMEIEFMMQQQQQLFSALSNVMKSMHDTKMSIIGNIR